VRAPTSAVARSPGRSRLPSTPPAHRRGGGIAEDAYREYRRSIATWDDVRRLALSLPETSETDAHGHSSLPAWKVKEKTFAWVRPLRKSDLDALGPAAPTGEILGARVEHEGAKLALIESEPELYFTTPHFDGYPAVLVQLEKIEVEALEELIIEAWLARAPKRLASAYLDSHGG
jgi:hypothetical protein